MTDQQGFTLLEVMVALAILALGLTGLFRSFDLGLRAASTVDQQRAAIDAANTFMAELGRSHPLTYGSSEGDLPHDRHWRLVVEQINTHNVKSDQPRIEGHLVTLTLSWKDRRQERALSLRTVRLGYEE